jgi:proteasome lid subunit RPN8/RPN11
MPSAEKNCWTIENQAWNRILGHTVAGYPKETCGMLLCPCEKTRHIARAYPTKNTTFEDPARRYLIDPLEFLEVGNWAEQKGFEICGFYHSHPDHPCVPSEHDRQLAWEGYLYLIVSVKEGLFDEAGAWTYDQGQKRFNEVIIQSKYRKNRAAAVNPEESKP